MGFNVEKMKKFTSKDLLVGLTVSDLEKKGHTKEKALELTYNMLILGDSEMERVYEGI